MDVSTGERFTAKYNDNVSLSARVFKTIVDPFIGKYSLMKICTGTLKPDSNIYNVNKDTEEKIGKIYLLRGKDAIEVPELKAGDIGAVSKLSVTQTGDTIALRSAPIVYHKPEISTPYTYMRYKPKTKGDDDKVSSALSKLTEEDWTLKVVTDTENHQSLIYGIGDQQLDVVAVSYTHLAYIDGCSKFRALFHVTLPLSMPIITYVTVTQFMTPWMDYILPNLLLSRNENRTLAVGLYAMINEQESTNFTMFAAGAVRVAVPISMIYIIVQKYIVQGVSAGANKE